MDPIPFLQDQPTAGDYHGVAFDPGHALAGEDMALLAAHGIAGESYYARQDGENAPYFRPIPGAAQDIWCRRTVAEKLERVNAALAPRGLALFVWDGYRPVSCQQGLWDFFTEKFRRELQTDDPEILKAHTRRYVSYPGNFNPNDPRSWPAHSTGGAVDLTLCDLRTGGLLDMGTHFDDMRPLVHTDHFERLLAAGAIAPDHPPLLNRRTLYWAMHAQGFTNYPYEYFHFGWGDQLSALLTNASTAWYGYKEPPAECRIFKATTPPSTMKTSDAT